MTSPKKPRSLRITLLRSLVGYPERQHQAARGLGLRKIRSSVVRPDTPETRGLVNKIVHLVKVDVEESS
jgi:large subunit ribosomal protein L30